MEQKIISSWKALKFCLVVILLFWIGETIVYLFIDGWHFKPISRGEELCDLIVSVTWTLCFVWFLTISYAVMDTVIEALTDNQNSTHENDEKWYWE